MSAPTPESSQFETPDPLEAARLHLEHVVNELGAEAVAHAELYRITSDLMPDNAGREIGMVLHNLSGTPVAEPGADAVHEAEQILDLEPDLTGVDEEYAELIDQHNERADLIARAYALRDKQDWRELKHRTFRQS